MTFGSELPRKYHREPMGGSKQQADLDRLIPGRSSSIRKLQRWARAGRITLPEPSQRTVMRHRERRRDIEKQARIAATAAWNDKQ